MYSFHEGEFTLRPEMTAPVIRSYIENRLDNLAGIQKLFYIGNMFRHERPQAGRYREFNQFGAEAIGSNDFLIDAEMITLAVKILENFGLRNVYTKLNTIGTLQEREPFLNDLKLYLKQFESGLSETSKRRLENNPLRILDTKDEKEKEILNNSPILFDYLSESTKKHFSNVLSTLDSIGVQYEIDYNLVRGFDYYTSTTFEVISNDLGSQNAILGGGRYDMLIEQLGGKSTPAIGFACGIERLMIILEKSNYIFPEDKKIKLYIAAIGEKAKKLAFQTVIKLRSIGINSETDFYGRSVKAQMKEANKFSAEYSIVLGENEMETGIVKLKNMSDGSETEIILTEIENYLKEENEN